MAIRSSDSGRIVNVDVIRVIAMLLVVVLHTVLSFTLRPDFFGTKVWWLFEPLVAVSKTSVLLFFILSGYLVIGKNRSIGTNLAKIKKVIIIPFCTFYFLDVAFTLFTALRQGIYAPANFWTVQGIRFLNFPSSSLWFLEVLFFLYILNPIWQLIFSQEKRPSLAIYTASFFLVIFALMNLVKVPGAAIDPSASVLTGWLGFVVFYLYGGLVAKKLIRINRQKFNLAIILAGFILTIVGDHATRSMGGYIASILSLPIALMAAGIFNLLLTANLNWLKSPKIVLVSGLSFGVYLIHPLVVALLPLTGFTFDHLSVNVYAYNLVNYTLVLSISLVVAYLIAKIPKVRAIIGA